MATTVSFPVAGLPKGSRVKVSGNDLLIFIDSKNFPHVTFHAGSAAINRGTAQATYSSTPWYHVALRTGCYYGRIYKGGWGHCASETTTGFDSEKELGESICLDIEQIISVT